MSIVKDLLLIVISIVLVFILKKNFVLRQELFSQREDFIKTLSHDLRVSTLAQIRGLDLLQKRCITEELINEINGSCKYSLDMINMLLNTYRYENGEQILNYEIFNFSDVFAEVASKLYAEAHEKNVEIFCSMKKSETIQADKLEITKFLYYLLSTAIFNSNRGEKILIIARKKHDNMEVVINYSGVPLSEEECKRMFSNSSRFSTVGHGIKMLLCKKIIEFHGGKISVNNYGNRENSFVFTLPIAKSTADLKPIVVSKLQMYQL